MTVASQSGSQRRDFQSIPNFQEAKAMLVIRICEDFDSKAEDSFVSWCREGGSCLEAAKYEPNRSSLRNVSQPGCQDVDITSSLASPSTENLHDFARRNS